jgi:tRNA modification GTPase
MPGNVAIDDELRVDAVLYLFFAPYSYTGDDVAEIHVHAGAPVTQALLGKLLGGGLRMAGPGEFTARAYLTGKMDLAQAEAVNEVVVSSNSYQLTAAEKLLAGRLGEATAQAQSAIMDLLGLVEAGIDFCGEDIEFISRADAGTRLADIKQHLERLASASISYESVIDLPAVGIAGAPNAGKSTLLNKLLGTARSIVSPRRKTTRDVLTGELSLEHCRCVLFDCAGLTQKTEDRRQKTEFLSSVLDELAQQAAIEALRNSSVVVFCVDVSKADWAEDVAVIRTWFGDRGSWIVSRETSADSRFAIHDSPFTIPVATKCDLLPEQKLAGRLARLNELFGNEFLPISAKTGAGLGLLRAAIDTAIVSCQSSIGDRQSSILLTARHRQAVAEAIQNIGEAVDELKSGNDEVAAMLLRAAYQCICDIHQPVAGRLDEQILQQIFSRFCIGK